MSSQSTHAPQLPGREPSLAALRMRRSRERRRQGLRCLTIELHETEIAALVHNGHLASEEQHDRCAVTEALYAFFDETLKVSS